MSEYAAFLRGMNVGGHRLTNIELKARFEELGFSSVSTFRASGNVIFAGAPSRSPRWQCISKRDWRAALGYAVPVFLRTAGEVRKIAAHQPFDKSLIEASKGKLQVAMLCAPPSAEARKDMLALAGDEDMLAFGERELYWLPSGGILDSVLDFKAIERLLGPMTTRTKGTIEQVAAKYFDMKWPWSTGDHGPLPVLLLMLSVVTGLVDAVSYLALGHVFVANMTGNIVLLGFALAGAPGLSVPASLAALAAFLLGALAGGRIGMRLHDHRGRHLRAATACAAPLLLIAFLVAVLVGQPVSSVHATRCSFRWAWRWACRTPQRGGSPCPISPRQFSRSR